MKKIIVINGLIAGFIVSAMLYISLPLQEKGILTYDNGMLVGYTSMVLALSLIFVGVKSYRDNHQNGVISFGEGLKIGLLIAAVAALVYAFSWEIYFNTSQQDFMAKYTNHYVEKMAKEGASTAEIDAMKADMQKWSELYQNFFVRFGMTLAEILPVGIIISLLSATILRRKTARAQTV